ncbi:zinc finger MYM-type protein 1 [Trichonephila clavipes]|nr:zinc finger MYM-type protein 1 [Trichonephila clavipes]
MYDMNQIKKLNEYQDAAKKLSPSVETEYSDVNKRRVISKFSDKSTEKAVYGTEKFKRDTLIVVLDKLIFDLNRSQVYAEYSKKFKFLMGLQDQSKENICDVLRVFSLTSPLGQN